ncbi:MAG: lipid-A-disaccharide synthase [Caulobacteraceae bacterium]|nr:lipid-A-disaccharide synthase [Caulobacteraceae bacterium]
MNAARPLTVMLVAGEASGDALGAGLARALRRRLGEGVRFVGVGGARMAEQGVDSLFDIADLSILGLWEGVKAYPRVVRLADATAALARRERPDVAVLIDQWGFTLRVAQRLRRQLPDTLLVKYVGPQVWASRPGRARTLARAVDHLLAIHAFDAPYFEREGLATTFVGNPALARDYSQADPARLRAHIGAGEGDPILLVLPGSRPSEMKNVLPPFADAARRLLAERPDLRVVVPVAETVAAAVRAEVAGWGLRAFVVEGALKDDAMLAGDVALACSGTVTTELALAGRPMVVGYRIGRLSYVALKALIRTRFITLFNIAAQDDVAPELIQDACNGPALAKAVGALLDDPERRAAQVAAQNAALEKMGKGGPDPSELAAETVLNLLSREGEGPSSAKPARG